MRGKKWEKTQRGNLVLTLMIGFFSLRAGYRNEGVCVCVCVPLSSMALFSFLPAVVKAQQVPPEGGREGGREAFLINGRNYMCHPHTHTYQVSLPRL